MSNAADRISRVSLLASLALHLGLLAGAGYLLGRYGVIKSDEASPGAGDRPAMIDIEFEPGTGGRTPAPPASTDASPVKPSDTPTPTATVAPAGQPTAPTAKPEAPVATTPERAAEPRPDAAGNAAVERPAEPVPPPLAETVPTKQQASEAPAAPAPEPAADAAAVPPAPTAEPVPPAAAEPQPRVAPVELAPAAAPAVPRATLPPVPPAVADAPVEITGAISPPAAGEVAPGTYRLLRRRSLQSKLRIEPAASKAVAPAKPAAAEPVAADVGDPTVTRARQHRRLQPRGPALQQLPSGAVPSPAPAPATGSPARGADVKGPATARIGGAPARSTGQRRTAPGEARAYASQVRALIMARRPEPAGASGTTVIGFAVGPSGQLLRARVHTSSGDEELDAMALEAVRGAAPFPAPPVGMGSGQLSFTIPFRFR